MVTLKVLRQANSAEGVHYVRIDYVLGSRMYTYQMAGT